jgi:hypothetical protein
MSRDRCGCRSTPSSRSRIISACSRRRSGPIRWRSEMAAKALEVRLRDEAKKIRDKYVEPPHTTDFAILYLPTEGLYAEALRRPGLVDALQRDLRICIAGPTTLAALLNSLQMGFRTLAIERRSSEVWAVLGAIKTEFGKFGEALEVTRKEARTGEPQYRIGRRADAPDRAQAERSRGPAGFSSSRQFGGGKFLLKGHIAWI